MDLFLFVLMILFASSAAVSANIYGRKGASFTFVCPYRKTSTDNVLWGFMNKSRVYFAVSEGTFLPSDYPGRDRVTIVGNHSIGEYNLKLSGLQETDEGTYQCIVSTNEKEYYFELLVAPSSLNLYDVVEDGKIKGTEGQSLTINCKAVGGTPPPDMMLEVNSDVLRGTQSINYTISVLQRSHDKKMVRCNATNDALESPMQKNAVLYLYLKPSLPVYNTDFPTTNDTQPLVVTCTSTECRPAGMIYWKYKSILLSDGFTQQNISDVSNDTYTMVSTLTLGVDRGYNGQLITCGVTHQTLGTDVLEATRTIHVYYSPDVTVFNKTHILTDTIRTMQCNADGSPDQYTYYKWQHRSIYGVLIRELEGEQNGILILPNVTQSKRYQDSGEYICTAGNGIGDRNATIKQRGYGYMTVNAQPVITPENNDITTLYGEVGTATDIHVYVYSVPKYTQVTWYKDTKSLNQNNKYGMAETRVSVRDTFHGVAVQLDGFKLTITISNLVLEDFTTYKLRLSGGYGQPVEHPIVLVPISAPQTPTNFSITDSSVSSISIQWDAGFNGGYDQTFHVEYRVLGTTTWLTKTVPTNEQTGRQIYVLPGLNDGTSYEVRMYAENRFNKSLPTDIDSILTVPVQESQPSTGPIIGGVVGGLVCIVAVILVVFYLRTRGSVFREKKTKTQNEDVVYQNQLSTDTYEEIDGGTNNDNFQSRPEDDSSKKTYEPLNMIERDVPNVYDELADQKGKEEYYNSKKTSEPLNMRDAPHVYIELVDQKGEEEYYNTSKQYEELGKRNKPNLYDDLKNKKE